MASIGTLFLILLAIIGTIGLIILLTLPFIFLYFKLKERKLRKKIPEEVIKEVQDAKERRRAEFQEEFGRDRKGITGNTGEGGSDGIPDGNTERTESIGTGWPVQAGIASKGDRTERVSKRNWAKFN